MTLSALIKDIESSTAMVWEDWLKETLLLFSCSTGTLHVLKPGSDLLELKAQIGVPEFLLPKMSSIPVGKGMAGIAAERMEAVQVCNLQTDDSGVIRPGAKDTKVEGAMTVPLELGGQLYGTLGIAKKEPYEFSDTETDDLMKIGRALASKIKSYPMV